MSKKPAKSGKAERSYTPAIINKKARHDYEFVEKLEAGIALVGTEVKSLRNGQASLNEAYCRIRDGELFLVGCNIAAYEYGNLANHDPHRLRKLLVRRRQIRQLETKLLQKGFTIVPARIYFAHGLAKVEVVVARGKTQFDKRQKIKERQAQRDVTVAMKRRR